MKPSVASWWEIIALAALFALISAELDVLWALTSTKAAELPDPYVPLRILAHSVAWLFSLYLLQMIALAASSRLFGWEWLRTTLGGAMTCLIFLFSLTVSGVFNDPSSLRRIAQIGVLGCGSLVAVLTFLVLRPHALELSCEAVRQPALRRLPLPIHSRHSLRAKRPRAPPTQRHRRARTDWSRRRPRPP